MVVRFMRYHTAEIGLFESWLEYTSTDGVQCQLLSSVIALLFTGVVKSNKIQI